MADPQAAPTDGVPEEASAAIGAEPDVGRPQLAAAEPHSCSGTDGVESESEPAETTWWNSSASFRWLRLLEEWHDAAAAGEKFAERCAVCMKELQATCSAALSAEEFRVAPFDWTPDVMLEAFGSTQQGTALEISDLDVRMTFEQFEVYGKERQLKYLKGIRANPGERFQVRMLIEEAKIPLLRLIFDGQLEVDLSMGGAMAGNRDAEEDAPSVDQPLRALLASAINGDAAVRFVRLVKAFAKASSLVDAHLGLPSSTSWTCLAIAFLQLEGCIPPGQEVLRSASDDTAEDAAATGSTANGDGSEDWAPRPIRRLWPVDISPGLLCRFLAFIEKLSLKPMKVSLSKGRCSPARPWTNSGQRSPPLFLEHPVPTESRSWLNLAQSLTWPGWKQVRYLCSEAKKEFLPPQASAPDAAQERAAARAAKRLFAGGVPPGKGPDAAGCGNGDAAAAEATPDTPEEGSSNGAAKKPRQDVS
mmetsp:Transcript_20441/g.57125  ORF Transcript_20441/g.57125 Transcript_20441/m.57125 type:complete len:475 (-) Transcript_20441:47-1471(-)